MTTFKRAPAAHGDALTGAFARIAERRASEPALVARERRATFGDLDRLAEALAARVTVEPGALVGLAAANGPAVLAGLLGLRRAGVAALLLDANAPLADRRRALGVLGAAAVLECRAAWPASVADFRFDHEPGAPPRAPSAEVALVKLTS